MQFFQPAVARQFFEKIGDEPKPLHTGAPDEESVFGKQPEVLCPGRPSTIAGWRVPVRPHQRVGLAFDQCNLVSRGFSTPLFNQRNIRRSISGVLVIVQHVRFKIDLKKRTDSAQLRFNVTEQAFVSKIMNPIIA